MPENPMSLGQDERANSPKTRVVEAQATTKVKDEANHELFVKFIKSFKDFNECVCQKQSSMEDSQLL